MIRTTMIAVCASGLALAAMAQDAPPPGCRWQGGGVLACKDGKGNWRRSGDDEIVGTYPMPKPKPKPKPAVALAAKPPAAAVAPAAPVPAPAPAPAAVAEIPATEAAVADAADAMGAPSAADAAVDAAVEVTPQAAPAPAPTPVEKPKSWWARLWDWVVQDVLKFLRAIGLLK